MNKEQLNKKREETVRHIDDMYGNVDFRALEIAFDAGVEAMKEEVKRLEKELKEWSKYED